MSKPMGDHIFLPLPNLSAEPKPPTNRQDQLRLILSNLEKQRQQVHQNIIASAKTRLDNNLTTTTTTTTTQQPPSPSSAVSSGPTSNATPSEGEIDSQGNDKPTKQDDPLESTLAALSTRFNEGDSDPVGLAPSSTVQQVAPPPQVQIAKEAMRQIDLYDRSANVARDYYSKALERRTSNPGGSTSSTTITTNQASSGSPTRSNIPTVPSLSDAARGSIPAHPSPIDASRDPRRRPK